MTKKENEIVKLITLAGLTVGGILLQKNKSKVVQNIGIGMIGIGGIGIASCLTGCNKKNENIDVGSLSENDKLLFDEGIRSMSDRNQYFKNLYNLLQNSSNTYKITINPNLKNIASFKPFDDNSGGNITFKNIKTFTDLSSSNESEIIEEFFHAFQLQYYISELKIAKRLSKLGSNVEFEAKFFKMLIAAKQSFSVPQFDDMIGLPEMFIYDLSDSNRMYLTEEEKEIYFTALIEFVRINKNKKDSLRKQGLIVPSDLYDADPTNCLPLATFRIVSMQ